MLKVVVAAGEALFATVATYIGAALVLFMSSATTEIPGFMSARTVKHSGRLVTNVSFAPQAGVVLIVFLSALFYLVHRGTASKSWRRAGDIQGESV